MRVCVCVRVQYRPGQAWPDQARARARARARAIALQAWGLGLGAWGLGPGVWGPGKNMGWCKKALDIWRAPYIFTGITGLAEPVHPILGG